MTTWTQTYVRVIYINRIKITYVYLVDENENGARTKEFEKNCADRAWPRLAILHSLFGWIVT